MTLILSVMLLVKWEVSCLCVARSPILGQNVVANLVSMMSLEVVGHR